jgi:hypothetical protein
MSSQKEDNEMKFILLLIILFIYGVLWSLPIWICGNLIMWAFHLSYHITLIQACVIGIALGTIYSMFHKEGKK